MRYLYYTNYQSGGSGLSNGIMSIEVGVILAHLTNRLLVLAGNVSPPANIVSYDGRVNNQRPSRITDLIDLPVPWVEPDEVAWQGLPSLELTEQSLGDLVFYFPRSLDTTSTDARSFARDRRHWLTVDGAHEQIPVLRLSEEPLVPRTGHHRDNLSFYSYLFYLDEEARRSVYRLLGRMLPKGPFAELARRVAGDLGRFNAVHLRRGDFKVTYGVTTLDRKPAEAIEAMDQVFSRQDPLVILTDERDDPFFAEIKRAYPHHHFIDWHILDEYGAAFAALPQTDSLSLAYLSQMVAAEAQEFIGTMTSTFTALVQRYRGNRGKNEAFRYLWNELPEAGDAIERGRHAISECIPLERGQMIEQYPGPYSWNRVSPLLNPAWMREWPESFLLPEVVATGTLPSKRPSAIEVVRPTPGAREPVLAPVTPALYVGFENLQVAVWCPDAAMQRRLGSSLGGTAGSEARNVIGNFDVSLTGGGACITQQGRPERTVCDPSQLPLALKQRIATAFALARHHYAWLMASAFAKAGRSLLVAGDTGGDDGFRRGMEDAGWELLDGGPVAIRIADLFVVPLGAREPEAAAARVGRVATPLESLVIVKRGPLHLQESAIGPLSPAAAVAELIGASLDFHVEQHRAVTWLCRVLERRPAAQVHFSRPHQAAALIAHWIDSRIKVAA